MTTTRVALILTLAFVSSACDLFAGPKERMATDQLCGGTPSEDCPLW
ncbi:MAG: hypothetical protein AAGA54_14975 [Myxococcota bacterium]